MLEAGFDFVQEIHRPEIDLLNKELVMVIIQAFKHLDSRHQLALWLQFGWNFNPKTNAFIFGVSEEAARKLVFDSLKSLKEQTSYNEDY